MIYIDIEANDPNIRYFDNDEEFYTYCVEPKLVTVDSGEGYYYSTFNFTQQYLDDVANGKKFIIKDENSQIFKRGCVSYRTITKPVQNLEQYFNTNYGN